MGGRLEGKIAIITGAGTGIGEAIARKFVREGAQVVLNGLPGDPVADVAGDLKSEGGAAEVYTGDIGEESHARACVQKAIDVYGRIDVLVNNAGLWPESNETQDYSLDSFEQMMHSNVRGVFLMTKYALPHLQKSKGCIVSAGSESGLIGLAMNSPYGGTKGWIHAFMRGVAVEQGKYGVRANCVCPGPVDTAWTHKETSGMNKKMEKMLPKATVLGRRGTPEEIANAYAFLASDEASYVTGSLFYVDGGTTIAKGPVGEEAEKEVTREPEGELELEHQFEGRGNMAGQEAAVEKTVKG